MKSENQAQSLASAFATSARAVLDCLAVSSEDEMLVLCNNPQHRIGEAVVQAALDRRAGVTSITCPELSRNGEEPGEDVAAAMSEATVVVAATTYSLSYTQARVAATAKGVRIATMPAITEDIFVRALAVDYDELDLLGRALAKRLSAASLCRITSEAGTDVTLNLQSRCGRVDSGLLRHPGAFGNLPAGEAYIAPLESEGSGSIVFDGSLAGYGVLREPLCVTVEAGRAIGADGEAGRWLLDTLDAGGSDGRLIAEFGIGTNGQAALNGTTLEDEKVRGTAHLAFGMNASFGGVNHVPVHIDGIMLSPTISIDGEDVLRNGELSL